MKKVIFMILVLFCGISFAHFGMIIPETDYIGDRNKNTIGIKVMFAHPFEGMSMEMEKPIDFGVMVRGKKISLKNQLKEIKVRFYQNKEAHKGWFLRYTFNKPGDYIFYTIPEPYWEPAEDKYIVHYTKVIVNAFGLQDAWDKEVGLKTEIVPLVCPYTLYKGNTFRGIVKVNGKPVPFAEVEVEYYNRNGGIKSPNSLFSTQVIKCDANGVFSYSFPESGWWGFSALNTYEKKIPYKGQLKEVEIGAVLWVKVYIMKR